MKTIIWGISVVALLTAPALAETKKMTSPQKGLTMQDLARAQNSTARYGELFENLDAKMNDVWIEGTMADLITSNPVRYGLVPANDRGDGPRGASDESRR